MVTSHKTLLQLQMSVQIQQNLPILNHFGASDDAAADAEDVLVGADADAAAAEANGECDGNADELGPDGGSGTLQCVKNTCTTIKQQSLLTGTKHTGTRNNNTFV